MKHRKIPAFILSLIIIFTLVGCTDDPEGQKMSSKKTIAVSIVPEATFVEKVCGDKFEIVTLIPTGASPETYEPTPKEMQKLQDAEIYFSIGVPTEETAILPSVNKNTKTVALHKTVSEVYPDREEHGGRDPHIWLSPKRVKIMVSAIADELSLHDPENAQLYNQNAAIFIKELNTLDLEIKEILGSEENRKFIVFHPSYGYFADDYGLTMHALEEHGKEATAKRLAEMVELAKEEKIEVIFYQAEVSSRQAMAFAEEIGGRAISLDPLSPDYIDNIKKMAQALSEAVK